MKMIKDVYRFGHNLEKYKNVKTDLVIKGDVENPKLTVFIPTYKRATSLEVTVKSVVSQQTDQDFEIVIVNNDPEEGYRETKELLERINDKRIYYYVNQQNIGPCANWNRGFELSRGLYISMIHDDDILGPYFVDSIFRALSENQNPGILGVDFYTFNSENMPQFIKPNELSYHIVTKNSFFFESYINIAGMTVRKDLWNEIGGFSEEFHPAFDTAFIYQALLKSNVINICNELVGYRKEFNDSMSLETMTNVVIVKEEIRRSIASRELVPKVWMSLFDKEYIYLYILGANNNWGVGIKPELILNELGFVDTNISKLKMIVMKLLLKVARRIS